MVRISFEFKNKKGLDNLIRYLKNPKWCFENVAQSIEVVANNCATRMQNRIKTVKDRTDKSQDMLEKAIKVEELGSIAGTGLKQVGVSFGVGRVSNLPPYWEILNDGGLIKGTGKFVPLGAFPDGKPQLGRTGGEWYEGIDKYCFFDKETNQKFIKGINYIDFAIIEADEDLLKLLKMVGEAYLDGAGNAVKSHFVGGIMPTIQVSALKIKGIS